jgi:hypothetical protein
VYASKRVSSFSGSSIGLLTLVNCVLI